LDVSNALIGERKMKNCKLLFMLVVCCAFGLLPCASYAQERTLTDAQLQAITNPKLETCASQSNAIDPATVIPTSNMKEHSPDRVATTLHGIWAGSVVGDSSDVKIDYFWIMDTKNNEAVIIALRNGNQSAAGLSLGANAPKLTYLLCPNEGYIPSVSTPMIHQFFKVANTLDSAAAILEKATGKKLGQGSLSNLWAALVASGYFASMPAVAFAGGYFNPIQIGAVANPVGPAGVSLQWNAEYRGGGATGIKYTPGVPLVGVEHGGFVGTSTSLGDYLVSSPGNGQIWKVEAGIPCDVARKGGKEKKSKLSTMKPACILASKYDLAFNSVTLGPLQSVTLEPMVTPTPASSPSPTPTPTRVPSPSGSGLYNLSPSSLQQ
jgi:hypothetical protein